MRALGKKEPLLHLLVALFPTTSRERLYSHVLCGDVLVDSERVRDPKSKVRSDAEIVVSPRRFVSRGGFKLDPVLESWGVAVEGKIFLDAGCSTGGFTDALLQRGARGVHAVDVGSGVLDWKLRQDRRVWVHESTNIMALTELDPRPDAAVADLSFRSLRGAASHLLRLTSEGWLIALVKPQFEWENPDPEFEGIVPEERLAPILERLRNDLRDEGVRWTAEAPSAVRGRRGNQEYLVRLEREPL